MLHVFRRSFHHESIAATLKKQTVPQLKSVAVQSGASTAGTKSEIIDRLVSCFRSSQSQQSESVLSFDLGYRNLAYCHLDRDANIIDWARVDLELPYFHPSVVAPIVRAFVQQRLSKSLNTVDTILIEQQRARSNGAASVLETTLRVNCVEAILWTSLFDAVSQLNRADQIQMLPILRQRVDSLWQSELDRIVAENTATFGKSNSNNYRKKQASSALVQEWLATDTTVKCSLPFKDMFAMEKKKDDLSDCLMQALAWFEWERYTKDAYMFYLNSENNNDNNNNKK